jgi:hypothetical protein
MFRSLRQAAAMTRTTNAPEMARNFAQKFIAEQGVTKAAALLGVAPKTLAKVAAGSLVSSQTLDKITPRIRTADEFGAPSSTAVMPPLRAEWRTHWSLEAIREAQTQQLAGDFLLPVNLARDMRTDDALFVPYLNRIAPQSSVASVLKPASGSRGAAVAKRAATSAIVARSTLSGIVGTLANHGIAIGYNVQAPNDAGTRIDFRHTEWPLEFVKWRPSEQLLYTNTRGGLPTPIIHGDGRWTIYRKFMDRPWQQDACVIPGGKIWASHAGVIADWNATARSHGLAKMIGELPAGIALQTVVDGKPALTPEAAAFVQMLSAIMSGDAVAGVRPAGSKTDFEANASNAWQVFDTLGTSREKAGMRIYTGTDAALGSMGGAPGVDISILFGVATTIVQGDLAALEQGLSSGFYQPWCAINEGDSRYAPSLVYQLPDPSAERNSANAAARHTRLTQSVAAYRANGFLITQDLVCQIAVGLGFNEHEVPILAPSAPAPAVPTLPTLAASRSAPRPKA